MRTLSQISFIDPDPESSKSLRSQEYFCIADVVFDEDVRFDHSGNADATTVTFGSKGYCLFSPLKATNELEGKSGYLYRLSFIIPEDELDTARNSLQPKNATRFATQKETGFTSVHRDEYEASPEDD